MPPYVYIYISYELMRVKVSRIRQWLCSEVHMVCKKWFQPDVKWFTLLWNLTGSDKENFIDIFLHKIRQRDLELGILHRRKGKNYKNQKSILWFVCCSLRFNFELQSHWTQRNAGHWRRDGGEWVKGGCVECHFKRQSWNVDRDGIKTLLSSIRKGDFIDTHSKYQVWQSKVYRMLVFCWHQWIKSANLAKITRQGQPTDDWAIHDSLCLFAVKITWD